MTIQEFSDQFDVLWNNIASNQAPGLNEYEKSVFLTNAEKQLVREYFNANVDGVGRGFDGSQKRQYDFSKIIRTESLLNVNSFADRVVDSEKLDRRSYVYLFPRNYFLSVNELLADSRWQYSVMAIDYAEYQRLMLKPYSFPVKRGAWRIITDKKNCNVWEMSKEDIGNDVAKTQYHFVSSWADAKRNLRIKIKIANRDITGNSFEWRGANYAIICTGGWDDDREGTTYEVSLTLDKAFSNSNFDDKDIVDAIQTYFRQVRQEKDYFTKDSDLYRVAKRTDGFSQLSAPSKHYLLKEGYTFYTNVIQLPMAEVIGKFANAPQYKLRYVKTPDPIILTDLNIYSTTDEKLMIDGQVGPVECELPEEMHEEILERAVTLAKIAWQGGTMTQAAQSNNRE